MEPGYQALAAMDEHLSPNDFFAAGRRMIAEFALYAYTQVASEGGFDRAPRPCGPGSHACRDRNSTFSPRLIP